MCDILWTGLESGSRGSQERARGLRGDRLPHPSVGLYCRAQGFRAALCHSQDLLLQMATTNPEIVRASQHASKLPAATELHELFVRCFEDGADIGW